MNNTNGTKNINICIIIAISLVFALLIFSFIPVYSCKGITHENGYNATKADSTEISNRYTQSDTIDPITKGCDIANNINGTTKKSTDNTQYNEVSDFLEHLSFWISLWIGAITCIISLLAILFTYNQHNNNKEFKEEKENINKKLKESEKKIETDTDKIKEDFKEDRKEFKKKLEKELYEKLEKGIKEYYTSIVYNRISATTSFLCQTLDNPISLPEGKKKELQKTLFKTIHKDFCSYLRYLSVYTTNDLSYDDEEDYIYLVLNNIGSTISRAKIDITEQHNIIYLDRCVNEISKTIQSIIDRESNRDNLIKNMNCIRDCLDCFIKKL